MHDPLWLCLNIQYFTRLTILAGHLCFCCPSATSGATVCFSRQTQEDTESGLIHNPHHSQPVGLHPALCCSPRDHHHDPQPVPLAPSLSAPLLVAISTLITSTSCWWGWGGGEGHSGRPGRPGNLLSSSVPPARPAWGLHLEGCPEGLGVVVGGGRRETKTPPGQGRALPRTTSRQAYSSLPS